MESEIEHLPSYSLTKEHLQRQLEIVKSAAQLAKDKIDYASAHNESLLLAISIVESFLRKKHRICYGGQAINAYLPKEHKFYDPEYSIPDYDFFTPNQLQDLRILMESLYQAGFTEVHPREGMHEGTIKLYVNYIPVADLTAIDPHIYRILSRRATAFEGISYMDANSLRMLMHLELSRPKGEVVRWEKVFERLVLFNEFVPISHGKAKKAFRDSLQVDQVQFILRYLIQNERVFAGGDLVPFYHDAVESRTMQSTLSYFLTSRKPILFFSPEPKLDAARLQTELQLGSKRAIQTNVFFNEGLDVIPSIHVLHQGAKPLVIIIEQSACHSYLNLRIQENMILGQGLSHQILRIASMDTLITLFFSLGFVQNRFFDRGAMDALANQLVEISIHARRDADHIVFPFLSIRCAGHQTTIPSLIKAKFLRMTKRKKSELRNMIRMLEVKHGTSKRNRTLKKN